MKILMVVVPFAPRAGGLEVAVELLSRSMANLGHEVKVATLEPSDVPDQYPFEVIRRPTHRQMMEAYRWCDVISVNGQSGWFGWQVALRRKPSFMVYHNLLSHSNPDTKVRIGERIRRVMRGVIYGHCRKVGASQAIADDVGPGTIGLREPYDDTLFRPVLGVPRDRDLIFIGRYVKLKGMSDLVDAVDRLRQRGVRATATFIGVGPEEANLREHVQRLNLTDQIDVLGRVPRVELPTWLSRHTAIVVPSRYAEGFGIVALEGIACGCVAIGSASGGLTEAIGPCGLTYPNTDVSALADRIEQILKDAATKERLLAAAPEHLHRHSPDVLAGEYVQLFQSALTG